MGCSQSTPLPLNPELDEQYKCPLGKPKRKNPLVFFKFEAGAQHLGRVVIELKMDKCPKTAENFVELCNHTNGIGFTGSYMHRIIPGFMIQGGDFEKGNGTGGYSIYGGKFDDENFKLKHKGPGVLSMANAGPNTNGSQFFITFDAFPRLDKKHVVFGQVIEGWHVIKAMEQAGTLEGKPTHNIRISESGFFMKNRYSTFIRNILRD